VTGSAGEADPVERIARPEIHEQRLSRRRIDRCPHACKAHGQARARRPRRRIEEEAEASQLGLVAQQGLLGEAG